MREFIKSILRFLGLLPFCKSCRDGMWRWGRIMKARKEGITDSYPTPSAELIHLIVCNEDPYEYYKTGFLGKENILSALNGAGIPETDVQNVLDFGCGCGRVLRRLDGMPWKMFGTDYNPKLTQFCTAAYPFAQIGTNQLMPPTQYENEQFDLVYQFSVFTHLMPENQKLWLDEFRRIIRPGKYLIFSTQGEFFMKNRRDYITDEMIQKLEENGILTVHSDVEGSNTAGTFQTRAFTENLLGDDWKILYYKEGGSTVTGFQDLYLVQRIR